MKRSLALLLVGVLLGTLISATGAPADVAGTALRLAKKAQRAAKKAQRTADSAKRTAERGAKVDRGVLTVTVSGRSRATFTPGCLKDFPLGLSTELPDGLRITAEKRLSSGFSLSLQNDTDGTLSGKVTIDCLVGVDSNDDPATFGVD